MNWKLMLIAIIVCILIALSVAIAENSLAESDRTIGRVDYILEHYEGR